METIEYYPLHTNILIIAVHSVEGTWKAYATPVPGWLHSEEASQYWQRDGNEIAERHARSFFPHLESKPYAS